MYNYITVTVLATLVKEPVHPGHYVLKLNCIHLIIANLLHTGIQVTDHLSDGPSSFQAINLSASLEPEWKPAAGQHVLVPEACERFLTFTTEQK